MRCGKLGGVGTADEVRLDSTASTHDHEDAENTSVESGTAVTATERGLLGQLAEAFSGYVARLVKMDGGELYLVRVTPDDVHIHLGGRCSGCPGATMTREQLLEPAVRDICPNAIVRVTTGWRVPEGAWRVRPL